MEKQKLSFALNKKKAFGFVFLLLTIVYLPSLMAHRHVDPDAHSILLNLRSLGSVSNYIQALFSFRTIDVQPVRDLFLSIDDFTYRTFSLNTFIFQNLILWAFTGTFFLGILKAIKPERSDRFLYSALIWFSVYPLFSSTLPWGMARKHILATLFILAAIERFFISARSLKDWALIISFYLLSVLSQPIDLLTPLWMVLWIVTFRTFRRQDFIGILILFMFLVFLGAINYLYYENSPVYGLIFTSKSKGLFSFADQLLATGHYVWTTFFPYRQAFMYSLSNISTLLGLILIVVGSLTLYFTRAKESMAWCILGILSLLPVISNPTIIQDTYLLLPSLAFFIALTFKIETISKRSFFVFVFIAIIWSGFSFHRNKIWLDINAFVENGFENDPNCDSATRVVNTNFNYGYEVNPRAMDFLKQNKCFLMPVSIPQYLSERRKIQSRALFYDKSIPQEEKKQLFIKSDESGNFYALIALTALSIEQKDPETKVYISKLSEAAKSIQMPHFDVIIRDYILPYCKEVGQEECFRSLERFTRMADSPWI